MFKNSKMIFISVAAAVLISGCSKSVSYAQNKNQNSKELIYSYSQIASKTYLDVLNDAKDLEVAINKFANNPNQKNFMDAKIAWLQARESYGQSEAFRLSNGPIDAQENWIAQKYGSLEGQLNAWPLDENLIDYTIDANGVKTSGNIIDSSGSFNPGGEEAKAVDITIINKDVLTQLNENGGEANVATGYHAIEFLLWGQDQDYSNFMKDSITNGELNSGDRQLSDFTTDKYANRRLTYLQVATQKLVSDLEIISSAWNDEAFYKKALNNRLEGENSDKNIDSKTALKQIFSGLGVFIKSELANERIAVAVLTPSEEDEHSCFSDNTHRDIAMNYQGFKNILLSTYRGVDYGISPLDSLDEQSKTKILKLMESIEKKISSIDLIAKTSRHFDYQIRPNDSQSKVIVKLKNELRKLGDEMINVAAANGIDLTTDDVTDKEETKI